MASSLGCVIEILADGSNNFGDTTGGGMAGPTGLFIILVLGAVTALLIRNMNKRIRRLPAQFPQQAGEKSVAGSVNSAESPSQDSSST